MKIPDDLRAAIDAEPKAKRELEKLSAQNRFALAYRIHNMKTEAGRMKKILTFVEMLKRGDLRTGTPYISLPGARTLKLRPGSHLGLMSYRKMRCTRPESPGIDSVAVGLQPSIRASWLMTRTGRRMPISITGRILGSISGKR